MSQDKIIVFAHIWLKIHMEQSSFTIFKEYAYTNIKMHIKYAYPMYVKKCPFHLIKHCHYIRFKEDISFHIWSKTIVNTAFSSVETN